jgi:hypothetical protein
MTYSENELRQLYTHVSTHYIILLRELDQVYAMISERLEDAIVDGEEDATIQWLALMLEIAKHQWIRTHESSVFFRNHMQMHRIPEAPNFYQ